RGGDSHGETGGFAHRLGECELGLRHCAGASRFCMQFSWNGPLAETHVPRMLFDDTVLWRGIHVLDLLPTQLAPADAGQAGADGSNRNRTAAMAVWKPSARPNIPVTSPERRRGAKYSLLRSDVPLNPASD